MSRLAAVLALLIVAVSLYRRHGRHVIPTVMPADL